MHCAAFWQHSSNLNIKIVHNSIEHFLWNPSDFFSDDVLSCLWIVFTNSVFQLPPQKIVRWFEILARGYWVDVTRGYWVDMKWVHPMGSYARGIQVFCSVWEMRCHLIPRTEQLNTSGITLHGTGSFCAKLITPVHPIPKISTHLTIFWGGTWKNEFVKTIYRQERTSPVKKSDRFHKKSSIELWTILMFELLLCCHTAVRCMEWT